LPPIDADELAGLTARRGSFAGGQSVARALAAGSVIAVLAVTGVIADAALIYSGPLSPGLLLGATAMLAAFAAASATIGIGSGIAGMASGTLCAIIYAAMAAAIDRALGPAVPDPVFRAVAVLVASGMATVLCGLALLLLGSFRLGSLAQLLPYPVTAGYYAGLAWLLAVGGVRVGASLSPDTSQLADPEPLVRLALCLTMAGLLIGLPRARAHWSVQPMLLLAAIALFHLGRAVGGIGLPEAQARGWLLGPFPATAATPLSGSAILHAFHPAALAAAGPFAASAIVLTSISLLMAVSGIELELRNGIDANRELRVGGGANLLGGALGGTPCAQSMTTTSMLHWLGGGSRLGALMPGAAALIVVAAGAQVLGLVPRFLVGGLLLSFGVERLILTWRDCRTLPRHETAIVLVVLLATAVLGIVPGLETGLALALLIFAWNYRRIPVVRPTLSGALCRSSVSRSPQAEAILRREGDGIVVYRLQGYLFFLNVGSIPDALRATPGRRSSIVLDFRDVVGMDSSAHAAFRRCEQIAARQSAEILLSGLGAALAEQFRRRGLLRHPSPEVRCFDTLDLALQHAEDALLRAAGFDESGRAESLADYIAASSGSHISREELAPFLQSMRLAAGDVLMRQGEQDRAMYFIERGRVSIWLERQGAAPLRLASIAAGSLVGELALYSGGVRSATVIADVPTEAARLGAESLAAMDREKPHLSNLLQRCLLLQMAEKLANVPRLIQMLR
jgi:SulP family sulfate permease